MAHNNNEDFSEEMKEFMRRLKEAFDEFRNNPEMKDDLTRFMEENRRSKGGIRRVRIHESEANEMIERMRSLRVYGDNSVYSISPHERAIRFILEHGIDSFLDESKTRGKQNEKLDGLYNDLYNHYVTDNQVTTNEFLIENIDFLSNYFAEFEEYEKCGLLVKVKDTYNLLFPKTEQNEN